MKKALLILLLAALPVLSYAIVRTIGWDAPTTYSNGDPLPASEVSYYNVYWGITSGGPYPNQAATVGNGTQISIDFTENNRIYIVATTVASNGIESDFSDELALNLRKPGPPRNLYRN